METFVHLVMLSLGLVCAIVMIVIAFTITRLGRQLAEFRTDPAAASRNHHGIIQRGESRAQAGTLRLASPEDRADKQGNERRMAGMLPV